MIFRYDVRYYLLLLFAVVFILSCSDDSNEETDQIDSVNAVKGINSDLVYAWYEEYLKIERYLDDFRPNPTTRALAYIGMAAYESVLPGMVRSKSLSEVLPEYRLVGADPYDSDYWAARAPDPLYWEVVLNHVYFKTFEHFLHNRNEDHQFQIDRLYLIHVQRLISQMPRETYDDAVTRAETIVRSVIDYAASDTESEIQILDVTPAAYVPPTGDGYWRPTEPDFRNACHPYWYRVRRFVTPQGGIAFEPPATYSVDPSSRFYREAKEVNDVVESLDFEGRWIAEFWSDDITGLTFSPPARLIAIANQLVKLDQTDLETALEMYLRLGFSLNDAAVICWQGKYKYNLERPIDYIRRVINPEFRTVLGDAEGIPSQNPNFPAYPSGHSTFASAGTAVFQMYYGDKITEFTDRCHEGRNEFNGAPRTYRSFYDMAAENAYSRIPLGVHFRMDCDEGLRLGYEVGAYATALSLQRN